MIGFFDQRAVVAAALDENRERKRGPVRVAFLRNAPGVIFPSDVRGDDVLTVIDLSYGFGGVDLKLTDEGVSARLLFGGGRRGVFLPWGAIATVETAPNAKGPVIMWPEPLEPHQDDRQLARPEGAEEGSRARPDWLRIVRDEEPSAD